MANTKKTRREDLDEHEKKGNRSRVSKEAYEDEAGNITYLEYIYGADIDANDFLKLIDIKQNG